MRVRSSVVVVVLALALTGCGARAAPSTPPALTVYAAASLKAVLGAATTVFVSSHPGWTITLSTDSSAALETKIEQGAPADVFLSADLANPQKLVAAGLASGTVVPFASNRLVVIVPAGNPAGVTGPRDLARPGLKVVAAGAGVPITTYAQQLVANLAGLPGYPAGFAAGYAANVISREDNVAAVVSKIELGEGDAAIVYATDARAASRVETVAVPDAANVTALYGGVVVRASPNASAAARFLAWLAGPEGQAVLAGAGFGPAASPGRMGT